jgi:FkbM family methyltransferase
VSQFKQALKQIPGAVPVGRALKRVYRRGQRLVLGPTQIEQYDRETLAVLERALRPDASAIDVGACTGSVLVDIVRVAPQGKHWAFEPVPGNFTGLKARFPGVTVLPYALAEVAGKTQFHVTKANPAYSSLEDRDPQLLDQIGLSDAAKEVVDVEIRRLDDVIPETAQIALIKIDVAGAELRMLGGALATIQRCQPIVILEAGFYSEARSRELFELLRSGGLKLSTMAGWLNNQPPPAKFEEYLPLARANFYFLAHP